MKAWAIKKWNETFEAAATRKLRNLNYIGLPIDQGSMRFRSLMQDIGGAAAHGHFMAIVQWAATLPCRGLLVRSGRPLSVEQIAVCANIAPKMLHKTWPRLTLPEPEGVAWIEEVEIDGGRPPESFYWVHNPPPIRRASATDPPSTSHQPPGTPLALNTPNTPVHPNTPTHPCNGAVVADLEPEPDREKAVEVLTGKPWEMGPKKAAALLRTASAGAVMAAVSRARGMRDRGESAGAGLIAHWLENGDAEKWHLANEERRRKVIRANWDRTPDEDKARWLGRYFDEFPDTKRLDHAMVAASDRFMDWLGVAASKRS